MNYTSLSTIRLIELFVHFSDNKAFEEFHSRTQSVVEIVYKANASIASFYNFTFNDFETVVLGWIIDKNKFQSLLWKYSSLKDSNSLKNLDSFVKGYYYRIVQSGFHQYLHELYPEYRISDFTTEDIEVQASYEDDESNFHKPSFPVVEFNDGSQKTKESNKYSIASYMKKLKIEAELIALVDEILNLKPTKRIPVWLTYLVRILPLPEEDMQFLAELNNCSEEDIQKSIDKAVSENMDKSFAVTSEFIGILIQIPQNTVSVRIRRAKQELSSKIGVELG